MKIDAYAPHRKFFIYDLGVLLRFLRIFGEYVRTIKIDSPLLSLLRLSSYFNVELFEKTFAEYLIKYCDKVENLCTRDFHDLPLTEVLPKVRNFEFGVFSNRIFTYGYSLRTMDNITAL